MTTTPTILSSPTTIAGLSMSIEPGLPGPEAVERWSARANVLAAWLMSEWHREPSAIADSLPARLDPGACGATPRPEVEGAPEAA